MRRLFEGGVYSRAAFIRGNTVFNPVADPDLQIREGSGHPDPEIRGGGGAFSQKNFFGPCGLSLV